jgi:hypothetical protein
MFNAVKSTAKEDLVTEAAALEFVIDYIIYYIQFRIRYKVAIEQRRGSQPTAGVSMAATSDFQFPGTHSRSVFDGRNGMLQSSQEKPEAAPKLLIRLRYTVDGKKGRKPLEVDGTPSTVSLFHFYQAVG